MAIKTGVGVGGGGGGLLSGKVDTGTCGTEGVPFRPLWFINDP